jgi:hypothetical protein
MAALNDLIGGRYFNALSLSFNAGQYATYDDPKGCFTLGASWQSVKAGLPSI